MATNRTSLNLKLEIMIHGMRFSEHCLGSRHSLSQALLVQWNFEVWLQSRFTWKGGSRDKVFNIHLNEGVTATLIVLAAVVNPDMLRNREIKPKISRTFYIYSVVVPSYLRVVIHEGVGGICSIAP